MQISLDSARRSLRLGYACRRYTFKPALCAVGTGCFVEAGPTAGRTAGAADVPEGLLGSGGGVQAHESKNTTVRKNPDEAVSNMTRHRRPRCPRRVTMREEDVAMLSVLENLGGCSECVWVVAAEWGVMCKRTSYRQQQRLP